MKYTLLVPKSLTDQAVSFEIPDLPAVLSTTITGGTPVQNQSPTSNAGIDFSIQLPQTFFLLQGLASDPDNDTFTAVWEKVSGGPAVITPGANNSATVTGFTAGVYVFRLVVTDKFNASSYDEVTVTVKQEVIVPPPGGTLSFSKNYDSTAEIDTNQKPSTNLNLFISTTIKKSGTGSFKSYTMNVNTSQGVRCEEQYTQAAANPTEGVIEYDVYYENYTPTNWGGSSVQWHPNNNNSGTLFLYTTEGKFNVCRSLNGTNYYTGGSSAGGSKSIISNTWYHMRWEVKWSPNSDGYVRLYIDGVLYYSYTGVTNDKDGKPYLKIGQNNWGTSKGTTIYYDNVRIYTIVP